MSKTKKNEIVENVINRRSSVPFDVFSEAYITGAKTEKTPAEVASSLGMSMETFNQRAVAFRKFCKENGRKVLFLKTSRGRKPDKEKQLSVIDQLLAE